MRDGIWGKTVSCALVSAVAGVLQSQFAVAAENAPQRAPLEAEGFENASTAELESEFKTIITISATLNQAFLIWDDGIDRGSNIVGSSPDSSNIAIEGETEFGEGWSTGFAFGLDILNVQSDTVSQLDSVGDGQEIKLSDLYVNLIQEDLGEIVFGYADTASDGVDNYNFANADPLASMDVNDWNNEFFIRANGIDGFGDLRWGDFIDGALAGDTRGGINYTTPVFHGFSASAGVAGGDYYDASLTYEQEWAEQLKVVAAIGAWRDTQSDADAEEPKNDVGWGGSVGLRHLPSGLNIAFNYSTASHTDRCAEPGAVSGRCRGDDHVYHVIGGIVRDFTGLGNTSIFGEYYRGLKGWNDSDSDILEELELNAGDAAELTDSTASVYGVGIVQYIKDTSAAFYVGYRRYELDVDLVDGSGAAVPSKSLKDLDMIMTGVIVKF